MRDSQSNPVKMDNNNNNNDEDDNSIIKNGSENQNRNFSSLSILLEAKASLENLFIYRIGRVGFGF